MKRMIAPSLSAAAALQSGNSWTIAQRANAVTRPKRQDELLAGGPVGEEMGEVCARGEQQCASFEQPQDQLLGVSEASDEGSHAGRGTGDDQPLGGAQQRGMGARHSRWPAIGGGGFSETC